MQVEYTINIPDRLNKNMIEHCKFNNLTMNDFILQCIERGFNLERFGDINPKQPEIVNEPITVESIGLKVMDVIEEKTSIIDADNKTTDMQEVKTVKKTRRTIKSK